MSTSSMYYPYPLGGTPNGRYRSATTTTSCNTAGASYISPGTGTTTTSSTWVTVTVTDGTSGTTDTYTTVVIPIAAYNNQLGTCEVKPPAPRFEDAGVTAGEIIGYRAWFLRNDTLYSMYMQGYAWTPSGVEHAPGLKVYHENFGTGLHAFKDLNLAIANYTSLARKCQPVVFGEVAMWGEVYEHEHGYRAEFAAIRKIYCIMRKPYDPPGEGRRRRLWRPRTTDLQILRERYGVVE